MPSRSGSTQTTQSFMEPNLSRHTAPESKLERLKRMLTPQSAVFIGGPFMTTAIEYCRAIGFRGRLHVVNPRRAEIAGIACLPNVASLPEVPDVAYVAVPNTSVVELIRELSRFGVGGVICHTAGFSEMHGGERYQQALVEAAGDMPVIGPNCPGMVNFLDRSAFMMDNFGNHEGSSGVALISSGGSYLLDIGYADRSLPVSYSVGLGNQAMVSAADVMNAILDDARVSAINLYLEGIPDPVALAAAGLKAARKGIPVVVLKGGRTTAGRRAAQSHTASLAGDDVVMSALFRRLGFVQVRSATEAMETLKMLMFAPRVRGRRTALASTGGTYAVQGGDMAEAYGLELGPPSPSASKELEKYLPALVHSANPLDISFAHYDPLEQNLNIYKSFLSDDYDLALMVMCYPPDGGFDPTGWDITSSAFAQAAGGRGIPAAFINTIPEDLPGKVRERMIGENLVPLMGMEDGMRAVANAVRFSELADQLALRTDEEIALPDYRTGSTEGAALDEAAAKAELGRAGISVPRSVVVKHDQTDGLDKLTFPVVVKALSAELAHKSDLGAVALRLGTPEAALKAVRAMADKLQQSVPDLSIRNFLVEEMVQDGVGELLVGIRRIDAMGLALTVGMGGTDAELLRDTATLLLPVSPETIGAAVRSLKLFPLLDGWRGRPKGDVDAAVNAIQKLAELAIANENRFIEAEINPLIVCREGQGAVAVDAVIRLG
ncbi:CoA-binding protein [Phyllobacterium sophorae]|uniref:CoA-binding protein n=2 Tax=Phyllobacterium sophorae TaxID=1520277 RepID=A0A2P7AQN6_9HYPH|nr:CoA-binding protein [Phyllobacterium sophorae]